MAAAIWAWNGPTFLIDAEGRIAQGVAQGEGQGPRRRGAEGGQSAVIGEKTVCTAKRILDGQTCPLAAEAKCFPRI